jgi:2-haloacid dehalogenase
VRAVFFSPFHDLLPSSRCEFNCFPSSSHGNEYYLICSTAIYKDFSHVTEASLKHALAESSVSLNNAEIESLMHAYDSLAIFPDVKPALESLKSQSSIDAYIFTNGANAMVSASVNQSPSLSPFAAVFKALVTVDDIKVFKPDPRCYYHLADSLGVGRSKEALQRIWLVSSNPFDVVGARAAGMRAAWVDRVGLGWVDGLGELAAGGPTVVVKGLDEALREIERLAKEGE